jgi:hypothetical protein
MAKTIFDQFRDKAFKLCSEKRLLKDKIVIRARALTTEEAIGNPEGEDFPLQKGKERLMQAEFRESKGQAFTDQFGDFEGSVEELFSMPISNNYRRSVFVAAINAIMKDLEHVTGTVHCRDSGPTECAGLLASHIEERFGTPKLLQVGFQPKFAQALAEEFPLRLLDLDPDNIGIVKYGVRIEGPESTEDALDWADLLLVTGTTLANDTIGAFLTEKPVVFYGTTIAGAAALMGWKRFCAKSF